MPVGLTVASQSLDIEGAWEHNRSIRRLLSTFVACGQSEPLPYVPGRVPHPTRPDEIIVDMELMVTGYVDGSGTPHADLLSGLDANLEYLNAWARGLSDGSTVTYPAALETNSGEIHTADVQIINWQILEENVSQVVIGYDIRISAGLWEPSAS